MRKDLGTCKLLKKNEKDYLSRMIKVIVLGAGNVGHHLFSAMHKHPQINVVQWYNKSIGPIEPFVDQTVITTDINTIATADIYLICITDSAISEVSNRLSNHKGIIVHTAGSIAMEELNNHENYGVFYPLQSFSKQREIDFSNLPFCIEANNQQSLEKLEQLAAHLSQNSHRVNSKQRKTLHLAAVFVNNFTNHMYAIGEKLCKENELSFTILEPLIDETTKKIKQLSPKDVQTGPALRNDQKTIDSHLAQLPPNLEQLYKNLTKSIQQHYGQ